MTTPSFFFYKTTNPYISISYLVTTPSTSPAPILPNTMLLQLPTTTPAVEAAALEQTADPTAFGRWSEERRQGAAAAARGAHRTASSAFSTFWWKRAVGYGRLAPRVKVVQEVSRTTLFFTLVKIVYIVIVQANFGDPFLRPFQRTAITYRLG